MAFGQGNSVLSEHTIAVGMNNIIKSTSGIAATFGF